MRVAARPLLLLSALLLARPAVAAWPESPYANVPVSAASARQGNPRAIPDGSGGAFIVWEDSRGSSTDIYAQRMSSSGVPLWTVNGVAVCTAIDAQTLPVLASDGAGGIVIAWQDQRASATTGADIWAQRLNGGGLAQWAANGVSVITFANTQGQPQIATGPLGGAIVVWSDLAGVGGGYDIYAQRLSGAGGLLWGASGTPVAAVTGDQLSPVICSDGVAGVIVAWQDARAGAGTEDIYGQRVSSAGTMLWTANGVSLCAGTDQQLLPVITADGSGGAIVAWNDARTDVLEMDIYAQQVNSSGSRGWGTSGALVSAAAAQQAYPELVSDGEGGAIIVWQDLRSGTGSDNIFAQRMTVAGVPLWAANGVSVCSATGQQLEPGIDTDGAGGAIVTWSDLRYGPFDLFAQRITATGVTTWTFNGVLVSGAANSQRQSIPVADGAGGAMVVWQDERSGISIPDIYAHHVERYGQIGQPEPVISGVRDVANDQGGFVRVTWNRSPLDADPLYGIVEYRLWRSAPASLKAARAVVRDPDEAAARGVLLASPFAAFDYAWQLVGSQAADALTAYQMVTATTTDSVSAGNPFTVYMVEARASTSASGARWYSLPDSGYSVDDLAPPTPAPFTGRYEGATTYLAWGAVNVPDLAGYRLYRGTTAGFTPGPGNLVASLTETQFPDVAGAPYVYKLVAEDVHGNRSPVATLLPDGVLDAPSGAAPRVLALAAPSPNPLRASTRTHLRYALPRAGEAQLDLLDLQGRRLRVLASGAHDAGEHTATLEGRALEPGVYLVRLLAGGEQRTRRLVVM